MSLALRGSRSVGNGIEVVKDQDEKKLLLKQGLRAAFCAVLIASILTAMVVFL
ncbi:MAG: hypothetical protein ACKVS6_16185 [Planctomycetota bacterium]